MESLQCTSSPVAMILFLGLTHAVELSRVSSILCLFPFPCRLDKVSCSPLIIYLQELYLYVLTSASGAGIITQRMEFTSVNSFVSPSKACDTYPDF